jgi:hypothetical protein
MEGTSSPSPKMEEFRGVTLPKSETVGDGRSFPRQPNDLAPNLRGPAGQGVQGGTEGARRRNQRRPISRHDQKPRVRPHVSEAPVKFKPELNESGPSASFAGRSRPKKGADRERRGEPQKRRKNGDH